MTSDLFVSADGSALLSAFDRLLAAALAPEAPTEHVLEAAAMGVALAELGLVQRAFGRDRVVSRVRKALLGVGALRSAAIDEDALDALDLAIDQARRGLSLLAGGPVSSLDGGPTHEPTPEELGRLVRGELDGFAAADVAIRLHRSGVRDRYAAFLPEQPVFSMRLAADSAPLVRDPSLGRLLGVCRLGQSALEAHAFDGGVLAIYAEPAIGLALVSIDAAPASRASETAGYLELVLEGDPEQVTLVLADGDRSVTWTLRLRSVS